MASKEAQNDWRGKFSSIEGVSTTVPHRGSVAEILYELDQGIRSALSYTGVDNLDDFRSFSKFVKQSAASRVESSAHIFGRFD